MSGILPPLDVKIFPGFFFSFFSFSSLSCLLHRGNIVIEFDVGDSGLQSRKKKCFSSSKVASGSRKGTCSGCVQMPPSGRVSDTSH